MGIIYAPSMPGKKLNIGRALMFGEAIVYLTDGHQAVYLNNLEYTYQTVKEKMAGFCDDDYLLPIGSPTLIGIMAGVAFQHNDGRATFLHWDKKLRDYIQVSVDISDIEGNIND